MIIDCSPAIRRQSPSLTLHTDALRTAGCCNALRMDSSPVQNDTTQCHILLQPSKHPQRAASWQMMVLLRLPNLTFQSNMSQNALQLASTAKRPHIVIGTHRDTLHIEHAVETIRPTTWPSVVRQSAMAQHDVVLILHLWGAVGVDVLPDELPDLGSSSLLSGSFAMKRITLLLCNSQA